MIQVDIHTLKMHALDSSFIEWVQTLEYEKHKIYTDHTTVWFIPNEKMRIDDVSIEILARGFATSARTPRWFSELVKKLVTKRALDAPLSKTLLNGLNVTQGLDEFRAKFAAKLVAQELKS